MGPSRLRGPLPGPWKPAGPRRDPPIMRPRCDSLWPCATSAGSRWPARRGPPSPPRTAAPRRAVKVLGTDPIQNTVSSLTGSSNSISATPWPRNHASDPSRTTPPARPAEGQRSRTSATLGFRSSSSLRAPAPLAWLRLAAVGQMVIWALPRRRRARGCSCATTRRSRRSYRARLRLCVSRRART